MSKSLEELRWSYKPSRVRFLFLGESSPAGGTFFYRADSNLYRYTCQAFEEAGILVGKGEEFLRAFQSMMCFLDDLCPTPMNSLRPKSRQASWDRCVPSLVDRLTLHQPEAIVVVMQALVPSVEKALLTSGLRAPIFSTPFPAQGWQGKYVKDLAAILMKLGVGMS